MTEDTPPPQPAPPPAPSSGPDPAGTPGADERQWALFAHLSALAGLLIPFGNILGPLIVWQIKKNEMPFVDDQGKEALNFQITVLIAVVVCLVLSVLLIGLLLLPVVAVADLVLTIVAAIKANQGETYRYPFTLRLIS